MVGGLIDDEQRSFKAGSGCVDQIFTPKQIVEGLRVYACFMDLEKGYVRVNRKSLWLVLRMYDLAGSYHYSIQGFCKCIYSLCLNLE